MCFYTFLTVIISPNKFFTSFKSQIELKIHLEQHLKRALQVNPAKPGTGIKATIGQPNRVVTNIQSNGTRIGSAPQQESSVSRPTNLTVTSIASTAQTVSNPQPGKIFKLFSIFLVNGYLSIYLLFM